LGREEKGQNIAGKRYTTAQVIPMLREAEVDLAKGRKLELVAKKLGITEQTYYRWRKCYGGLKSGQAKRLVTWRKRTPG
jgi:putative transposase